MKILRQKMGSLKIYVPSPCDLKVTEEGPSDDFFSDSSSSNVANSTYCSYVDEDVEAPTFIRDIDRRGRGIGSVLANLHGQVQIDDDSSPAPENIPASVE